VSRKDQLNTSKPHQIEGNRMKKDRSFVATREVAVGTDNILPLRAEDEWKTRKR